ncbi:MAG TPA: zinc-binding dehydrogenase [Candidatus Caccalectryoclostridium excrementigallinarum]|uniref:Zinc-binding dehydrogenase n=1 Tax=Candidatus Caccalectryoclostridium excrementigallinarum TaxID=2840710 RepID=A0A9D1MNB9_9FIRM|nr:zinc-binding dehydrogenase [Candidatus Caccalectryoclostridium excrementigallinarum]
MNYWTFDGDNSARLIGDETENENSGCAKVKIIRSSIDNSDIFAYTRKKAVSIVPSSSAAGLISECPTGEFKSGQRVFLSCSGKSGSDGASGGYLRDYVNVSTDYIYELPDVIADNDIVFIDSIAKACNLIDKLEIKPAQTVIINGVSVINLIIAQLLRYHQALPIMIDSDDEKLGLAQDLGVDFIINSSQENVPYMVKSFTSGKMASALVVDLDILSDMDELPYCLAMGGKIALINANSALKCYKIDFINILNKELSIFGIKDGDGKVSMAINLLAMEKVKVSPLIGDVVGFSEVPQLMEKFKDGITFKMNIVKCNC